MKLIPREVNIELDEEELKILDQAEEIISQINKVMDSPDLNTVNLGDKTDDYVSALLRATEHLQDYI